jgi:uncharacterized membrane protein YcaP (DUF421 family)
MDIVLRAGVAFLIILFLTRIVGRRELSSLEPFDLLEGQPIIIIDDGEIVEKNVKAQRLTQEEIAAAPRIQGVGSLDEIRWGVLETNGQISFIKKSD